ncbi:hypothetical protein [uncultured Formosa sp.]|uniref:hypothetical protein n=1 Tax=uncultured Formosa sp. TaxID=255435 RepID=UPI00262081D9|nr:hypothetical protein [uncultured Formosa sp.]
MEKFIINTEATFIKNILLTNDVLNISDGDYKTKNAFLEKMNAEKKGILDTQHTIAYSKITKIVPFENENGIQLFFVEKKKKEKTYLELNSIEEYTEVLQYITHKTNHLSLQSIQNKPISSWIKQAGYTLVSLIFTLAITFTAVAIEAGKNVTITGGKRGLKRIMLSIAETLGTLNSVIVGTLITLGFAFWTYKKYINGQVSIKAYQ